jgi:hypothetical protein
MDGAHVFGSSGIQRPKKNTDSKTIGVLDLSLRKQWAIAISSANILTLVSGASEVEGILFAVLDPLEQSPVDLQLNDLEYSISGSTFSADLVSVIAASSDDESSRENSNSEEPQISGDFAPDDIFISGPDPFATEVLPTQTTTDESQRKSRRRRKDAKSDNPGEPSGVKSFDPFDPFA